MIHIYRRPVPTPISRMHLLFLLYRRRKLSLRIHRDLSFNKTHNGFVSCYHIDDFPGCRSQRLRGYFDIVSGLGWIFLDLTATTLAIGSQIKSFVRSTRNHAHKKSHQKSKPKTKRSMEFYMIRYRFELKSRIATLLL
ncbi:uncharacterized protein LOC110226739 [Arabidopsis lyrata subsp. lyrata]|uniref:uncharacterized protein LOC110226739 n=1 Tax=Arabidopsis lyrata subsp. lyrata TaxID=81972 RepID=UPI000A29B118|nr:uncharacterized protein LOC110226739 [Arabidopsis lyrata subsp. lyrata]|eukprot:XP_020874964.1 uncharacterized protein LOC110226739 [Arabidopsis lyrata subsp. lyrata]